MSALPEGWIETSLGEVIDIYSGKTRPKQQGDYPVYGGNGILNYGDKFNQEGETIIVGRVGAYCGNVFYENKPFWLSDNALGVKAKETSQEKFLYYKLVSMKLNNHAIGGAQPLLTQTLLKGLEINLPPLSEQKAIAGMLSSFDEKVELLREQNKTLETFAQTLFKEWFVNFNYPDATSEMVDSELGEIPKGWQASGIRELVEHVKKNIKPFDYPDKEYQHFSIPAFDSGQKPEVHCGCEISSNKYLVVDKSFLVSKLNPSTQRIWTVLNPHADSICSTEFQVIKPKNYDLFGFIYGALTSYALRRELSARAHGTSSSHQRVSPADILDAPVAIPPHELIENYSVIVNSILEKAENNRRQINSLSVARDALLPKLISGNVRVN